MKVKNTIRCMLLFILAAAALPLTVAAAEITSVDITVKAPAVGTVVKGNDILDDPGAGLFRQTPQPEVSLPSGANYELWTEKDENYGLWCEAALSSGGEHEGFTGRMTCADNYVVQIFLRAKGKYTFADGCNVRINGKSPETVEYYEVGNVNGIRVDAFIRPAHSWSWVVSRKAGLLKNGISFRRCRVCGEQQEPVTTSGYARSYVKSLKVVKGKKSFTVRWKKQSKKNRKKFNGYQIRYSKSPDMSNARIVTAGKAAGKKVIKRLTKKTRYYIQVRTFTKTSAGTFYSRWSARKSVKTK